jgi:hypothetical protein
MFALYSNFQPSLSLGVTPKAYPSGASFVTRIIFEHFAIQVDPVIEFIQLRSIPFKDSAILAPKLADPPFWWKSNSTPFKSGSGLPDLDRLIFCII